MTAPERQPPTIWLDCHITRRKTFHVVTDQTGRVVQKARALSTILQWLVDNDHAVVMLALEDEETPVLALNLDPLKKA